MKMRSILATVLAGFVLVACNSNDELPGTGTNPGENQETKNVYLKFDTKTNKNTRSVEESAQEKKAQFMSAIIYFVGGEGDEIVYTSRTVASSGGDATMTDMEKGKKFDKIPEAVKYVYVVGNHNSADEDAKAPVFPTAEGTPLQSIKNVVLDIQQVAYPKLSDNSTTTGLLTVLDGGAPVYDFTSNPSGWGEEKPTGADNDDAYANIVISPVSARIELDEIAYEGTVKDFNFEGIYVNNFYTKLPLSLNSTGYTPLNNGSFAEKYDKDHADFAYGTYNIMYDYIGQNAAISGGKASVEPANGVWAYHVFPETVPNIIIKLTGVVDAEDNNLGDRFVTVKGFMDEDDNKLDSFERGKLYTITDLVFEDEHIQILPNTEFVNLWVKVKVKDWETVKVKPIL